MTSTSPPTATSLRQRTWRHENYEISASPTRIPIPKLLHAFSSPDMPWAIPLSLETMHETIQNSLCFGVYHLPSSDSTLNTNPEDSFIGFARCITDFVTFLYLTDVYIWPEHKGQGLGKRLIGCVKEVVDEMPYLRKVMALTSDWERSVPFYDGLMGLKVVGKLGGEDGGKGVAVLCASGMGAV